MTRRRTMRRPTCPSLPTQFKCWKPCKFAIAQHYGSEMVDGFEYRGLGLMLYSSTKANYRRKDGSRKEYTYWCCYHLNTGHLVRGFRDIPLPTMLKAATALAELTDWTFSGLDGWQNLDPSLPDKMQVWHLDHGLGAVQGSGVRNPEVAREIGISRW